MRMKPQAAEEESSWQRSVRSLMALQSSSALVLLMVRVYGLGFRATLTFDASILWR